MWLSPPLEVCMSGLKFGARFHWNQKQKAILRLADCASLAMLALLLRTSSASRSAR